MSLICGKRTILVGLCLAILLIATGCTSDDNKIQTKPLSNITTYKLGSTLEFREKQNQEFLVSGWSGPEPWGRCTDGPIAVMKFKLTDAPVQGSKAVLSLVGSMFPSDGSQKVEISLNGLKIGEIKAKGPVSKPFSLEFDANLLKEINVIAFAVNKPTSPRESGVSDDQRKLGLGLSSMQINMGR